jgi:molybdate transport system ATP-binding protein
MTEDRGSELGALKADIEGTIADVRINERFSVAPGKILAVSGPSGSGKSTLLRGLAGLWRPQAGRISCCGSAWFDSSTGLDKPVEDRRVGFVFQDQALFPRMSALANVCFALAHLPRSARGTEAERLLNAVGLGSRISSRPAELSGGEQQRVALARAIASRPDLLLLDEPVASLDSSTAETALNLITQTVRELQIPCVLVTHSAESSATADDFLSMNPA